jgi:hypothetical protein
VLAVFLCRCLTVWRAVHANRAAANLFDADASPRSRQFLPTSGAHKSSTSYQSTPAVGYSVPCAECMKHIARRPPEISAESLRQRDTQPIR